MSKKKYHGKIEQSKETILEHEKAKLAIEQHKAALFKSIGYDTFKEVSLSGKPTGLGIKKVGKYIYIDLCVNVESVFFNSLPSVDRDDAADYFASAFNSMPDTSSVNILVLPKTIDVKKFIDKRNKVSQKKIQHYNPNTRAVVEKMIQEENAIIERELANTILQDYYICYSHKTKLTDEIIYSNQEVDIDEQNKAIQDAVNSISTIIGSLLGKVIVNWKFLSNNELQQLLVYSLTMNQTNLSSAQSDNSARQTKVTTVINKYFDINEWLRDGRDKIEAINRELEDMMSITLDNNIKQDCAQSIRLNNETLRILNKNYDDRTIITDETTGQKMRYNHRTFHNN